MKKKIRIISSGIISNIYKVYNYNIHVFLIRNSHVIYSLWIKNVFKKCGEYFFVNRGMSIRGGNYIEIGKNFTGMSLIRFECWEEYIDEKFSPSLIIGNNVSMNNNIHIGCINKIHIGDNVLLASNIFITDHFHGFVDSRDKNIPPFLRPLYSRGPVVIGDNVWIGENVTIMPNVNIGKSCIVGANSVVTKSFPDNSVIAGVPAKLIKTLN